MRTLANRKPVVKSLIITSHQQSFANVEELRSDQRLEFNHVSQASKSNKSRETVSYEYRFKTETITIQIDQDDCDILIDLDRKERNNHQKETRRHASLDAFNLDGNLFASEEDIEASYIQSDTYHALYDAIDQLLPQQKTLIIKVFFENRSIVSIAREEGVGESSIRDRLSRIYKKIKEILK